MGPILILALLGLIPYFKRGGILRTLGFVYTITPILLYFSPIPTILSFPRFRLMQPPAYIFLAASSVETLCYPYELISFLRKKKRQLVIFFVLLCVYLGFQIPMIRVEIAARNDNYTLLSWMNFLDRSVYDGVMQLKKLPSDGKIILSINNLELLIPVLS